MEWALIRRWIGVNPGKLTVAVFNTLVSKTIPRLAKLESGQNNTPQERLAEMVEAKQEQIDDDG